MSPQKPCPQAMRIVSLLALIRFLSSKFVGSLSEREGKRQNSNASVGERVGDRISHRDTEARPDSTSRASVSLWLSYPFADAPGTVLTLHRRRCAVARRLGRRGRHGGTTAAPAASAPGPPAHAAARAERQARLRAGDGREPQAAVAPLARADGGDDGRVCCRVRDVGEVERRARV